MATPDKNLDAIFIGTAEFSFAEGATTVTEASLEKGYRDLGNVRAFQPQTNFESQDHFGSYRGRRRKDKSILTQQEMSYQLRVDEWNKQNLLLFLRGKTTTNFTQSSYSSAAVDDIDVTSGSGTRKWYEITDGGSRVIELTSVTLTDSGGAGSVLTEGTDYEVDLKMGRVRFLKDTTDTIAVDVSAPQIQSGDDYYMEAIEPLGKGSRTGYGRLVVFDEDPDNNVVMDHVDFTCEISVESGGEVEGQNYSEITLNVRVTDEVGTLYLRQDNE